MRLSARIRDELRLHASQPTLRFHVELEASQYLLSKLKLSPGVFARAKEFASHVIRLDHCLEKASLKRGLKKQVALTILKKALEEIPSFVDHFRSNMKPGELLLYRQWEHDLSKLVRDVQSFAPSEMILVPSGTIYQMRILHQAEFEALLGKEKFARFQKAVTRSVVIALRKQTPKVPPALDEY